MTNRSKFDVLVVGISNNIGYTILAYVVSVCIGSALFCIAEGRTLWDSYYWAVTTALTIGYGDISPVTICGRIVFFIFAHLWVLFLVPCIVANIIVRILRNENEFTHTEQEDIKRQISEILQLVKNKGQ